MMSNFPGFFPPNPQGKQKERSHGRLGKCTKQLKRGKREQSVVRTKKSILPISIPCKQTAGFAYHYATKNLYGISSRFVQNGLMKGYAKVIVKEYRCR